MPERSLKKKRDFRCVRRFRTGAVRVGFCVYSYTLAGQAG